MGRAYQFFVRVWVPIFCTGMGTNFLYGYGYQFLVWVVGTKNGFMHGYEYGYGYPSQDSGMGMGTGISMGTLVPLLWVRLLDLVLRYGYGY